MGTLTWKKGRDLVDPQGVVLYSAGADGVADGREGARRAGHLGRSRRTRASTAAAAISIITQWAVSDGYTIEEAP